MLKLTLAALAATPILCALPMISVSRSGELVVNGPLRGTSLQPTSVTLTAAPSSGTASLSTATIIPAGTSSVTVAFPTTTVTGTGFTLPAAVNSVGHTVRLVSGTSTTYTVWAANGDKVDGAASRAVAGPVVVCDCTLVSAWTCDDNGGFQRITPVVIATSSSLPTISSAVGAYAVTATTTTTDGLTLPTPTVGASIKLFKTTGSTTGFTLATTSGSYFNGDTTTSFSVGTSSTIVTCEAPTTTRWDCSGTTSGTFQRPVVTISATTLTPTVAQSGTLFVSSGNGACTITLPTCDAAAQGTFYRFQMNEKAVNIILTAPGTDKLTMWFNYYQKGYSFYSGSVTSYTFDSIKYAFGEAAGLSYKTKGPEGLVMTVECGVVGYWRVDAIQGTTDS